MIPINLSDFVGATVSAIIKPGEIYRDRLYPDDQVVILSAEDSYHGLVHYQWLGGDAVHARSKDNFEQAFELVQGVLA